MSDGVIDERVVEMRFDNADFERNVNQSIKTIDKLKESLDFENAGESFENISAAASKCDMKPLEQSLEGITVKFNMLEMVAANVLGNITNKIVDAGAKLAKSLTVDQLTAGWSKYNQKTEAVQTIMSATGASIDVVNQKLEKLIWYADETSYDFVDMVNNIGKFTSAGVDLDTAVDSMMGISNWAAASGAGIQQASRAMYNLSQAIGMGYVGLTDWRSIELANMATKEFKETVIATAVDLGTLKQAADGTIKTLDGKDIVTAENMRGSLKKGWFDTDVLNAALAQYNEFTNKVKDFQDEWAELHNGEYITVSRAIQEMAKDSQYNLDSLGAKAFMRAQEATKFIEAVNATADAVSSGWMRTFEIIFGNYEQAKKLWTDLANDMYDVFAGGGERRNDNLSDLMQSNYQKMLNKMPDADEMNYRLYEKLYDITKSNLGMDYADQLFSSFENIEDLLKAYANNISESSLSDAMNSISEDFRKEADTALELSKQLKNGSFTLKQAVLRLVYGHYGKEIEDQKKAVEDLGFNYEMLSELAEQYKVGLTIPWDEYQKQLVESLDEQYDYYNGFVDSIKKLVPTEGFFRGLTELGGRDKLISSLQSIVDTFKNLYLTFVEIGNGVSDLMGTGSFLEKLIDGFYFLTSVIRLSDETFETWQEGISNFFTGGIQKKWKEFWHGFEVRNPLGENRRPGEDFAEDMQHIPGVLDYISAVYKDHLANLPEDVRNTVEKVKTEIFTFFGSIPQKINDLKTKIFGTFDVTPKLNLLTGEVEDVVVHTGGLLNNLKDRIRGLGNGLGGKIFDGILNTIKNIADFLFGYKAEDGTPIEGAFIKIYDKATAFWERLKDIGKFISNLVTRFKNLMGMDIAQMDISDPELGRFEKTFIKIYNFIEQVKTAISDAFSSISSWLGFDFKGEENGINIVLGIFDGIIEGIKNVGGWIKAHIFDPFVEGFKSVFGIHSPAEEMKPLGENIFLGILAGIWNVVKNIGSWIKSHIFIPVKNELSAAFNNFLENTSFGKQIQKIIDKFESLKQAVKRLADSKEFQTVKKFLLGEKDAEGNIVKNNIFGKIGTAVNFLKAKIDILVSSDAFQTVKKFLSGEKDAEGNVVKNNIFGKFGTAINLVKKNIGNLPDYIKKAKEGITDFFLGKKVHKGTAWSDELNSYIPIYEREGNLIDRLKEKFEKFKKVFESVKKYLFGYDEIKTTGLFGLSTEIEHVDGIIDKIKNTISDFINSLTKKKEKSLVDYILDFLGLNTSNWTGKLRNVALTLVAVNTLFSSFQFGKSKYTLFKYKSGLEAITDALSEIIDGFKELAISVAILVGTWMALSAYLHYIPVAQDELFQAAIMIGGIVFALVLLGKTFEAASDKMSPWTAITIRVIADTITQLALVSMAIGYLIKKTDSANEFAIVGGIMAGLILIMGLAGSMMMKDGKNVKTAAGSFIGFAAILHEFTRFLTVAMISVGIIYVLMSKGNIDPEILKRAGSTFVQIMLGALAFMAGIALIQAIVNKTASKINFSTFLSMVGIFETAKGLIILVSGLVAGIYYILERNKSRDSNGNAIYDTSTLDLAFSGMVAVLVVILGFMGALASIMNKIASGKNISASKFLFLLALMIFIRSIANTISGMVFTAKMAGSQAMSDAIGGLVVIILAVIGLIKVLDKIKHFDITTFEALLTGFIAIGGLITAVDYLLTVSEKHNITGWTDLLPMFAAIGEVAGALIILSLAISLLGAIAKIPTFKAGLTTAIEMFVGLGLLAAAVVGLKALQNKFDINTYDAILPMLVGIIELAGTMAIVAAAILTLGIIGNTIAPVVGSAILTILGVIAFVGVLAAIPALIDHFAGEGTVLESIEYLVQIIETLSEGLGKAIGAFIGGIGEGLVDSFEGVVDGLVNVANKLKDDFLPAIRDFTLEDAAQAGMMSAIMLGAFASEVFADLTALADKLVPDGEIEKCLDNLVNIAEKLKNDFLPAINDLSFTNVTKAGYLSAIMLGAFTTQALGDLTTLAGKLVSEGEIEKTLDNLISIAEKLKNDFLPAISDFSSANVTKAGYLSSIMLNTFKAETFTAFTTLVGKLEKNGEIDKVLDGLVAITGKLNAEFLPAVKDLSYSNVTSAGYLSSIMLKVLQSEVFTAAANFVSIFTKGGSLDQVVTGLCGTADILKTKFLPVVDELDEGDVKKADYLPKILAAIVKMEAVGGVEKLTGWLSKKVNYADIFRKLTGEGGVIDAIVQFSHDIEGKDFTGVSEAAIAMSSVFDLLGALGSASGIKEDTGWLERIVTNNVSLDHVATVLGLVSKKIVPCISDLQTAMHDAEIDADYIKGTLGVYVDLLRSVMEIGQNSSLLSGIEFTEIGQYVIDALVLALTDTGNTSTVKQAAVDLGLQIKDGLMFALDENSPSKVAFEIGKFVAVGLTQGLRAGEGMTWSMAQGFGEGTVAALENGLRDFDAVSQHAINMVTADLVDENRFNMPNLDIKDRWGNDTYDFELMRKFLIEKFGSVMDQNVINAFVNSYEQTMKEINNTINDKDYALMMTGIAAGDFGLSEQTIIDKLTEELGSTKAAKQAWEDYNAVKEGTLKINQKLLKEQKENPPMTLEQYMKMLADEEEGYQRALRGEFDKLARENGTSRAQEIENAGYDPILIQRRLNGHMNQEAVEAYIKQKALNEEFEESTRLVDNIIERNIDAQNSVNSIDEVTESVDELNEALSFGPEDILGEKIAIKKARADADALNDVSEAAENVAEAQQQVAETADTKTKALETETKAVQTLTNAERESLSSTRENNDYYKSLNKQVLDSAVETLRKGEKLTESETKMIMNAYNAVHEGAFGVGTAFREKAFTDYGLAEDNAKYLAKLVRYYNPASQSLKQYAKWESYAKDSNSELAKSNEETAESVKNVSTALENAPEFVQKFVKTVTPQIQKAITEGKDSFEIKASDFINFAGDEFDPTELLNYFKRNDLSELTDSDVIKWDIKDLLGTGLKDMSKEDIKQLLSLDVLGDALAASMGDIFGNGKEITPESFFGGVFDLFTNADKTLTSGFLTSLGSLWRTFKGINEEAEKINETKIAPDVDNSKVQEAISMADTLKEKYTLDDNERLLAEVGIKNLQNGIKLNEKQAEAVQKVWDGAMIGLYDSGEERLKQFRQLFKLGEDFTWDVLSRNIDQNGNFDISKQTSSALYYGKQVRDMIEAGEAYTNADLMKDINDLKWGVGQDRIDALTEAGYDAKKVQEEFLKWYNGDKSVENLGDDYLRISEAETEAAEQLERMNAALNQTPQGAFRSIADFLEGVSKVLEKKETADDFKSFITDIVESMKSLKIDNASDFERVASFLNSVRSSASGSHTIAEDFKEFVTGIKDSVKQLGEIDIQNTDGMDKVKEFLNGITIENKDTLDAVADFIRDIIDFSAGATEGSDYSSKLVESITLIQRAVNGLEIHEEATTPLVNFLHELTGSTEKLSTDSGKAIEQYINDFYTALEDPSQASAAATKIAQTLIEELQKYNTKFFDVGVDFVIMLAAGIIAGRQYVIEAAETIAGSILNTISEQATAKASEEGSKFIDNLITGMKSEDSQAKLKEALDSLFGPSEEQMDFSGQQETQPGSTPVGENLESTPGQKFAQQFITDLAEGITKGTESVQKAVESISNIISSGISIDVAGISTKAAEYVANLAAGLQAGFEENQDLLLEIVGAIASVISSAVPDGFSVGWNYMLGVYMGLIAGAEYFGLGEFLPEGVTAGMENAANDMYNATKGIFEEQYKVAEKTTNTNSPSRLYAELGGYLMQGLAIGIRDNAGISVNEMSKACDSVADAFTSSAGINSPSTRWREFGRYLMLGLTLGIQESANGSVKAVSDTCNKLSEVVNTVATDVNKKRLAFDIDTSGVHEAVSSVEELWKMYTLTDVEQVLAEAGFKNLQKGARITEQQAYVLQKVWDGAMIGLYDSGEKRLGIMKKLFNSEDFTWDTFRSMYENTYIDKGMRDLYTLKDAERAAAEAGIKNLQNGVKLTEEQADAVQKVWDGAMIGLYKSGDERIAQMRQMFNLDENFAWKDFAKYFNKDTHFNLADQIEKTKPAADSANTALQDLQDVVSTIFNFGQSSEEGTKLGETLLSQIVDVIQNNAGDAVDSMKYLTDLMNLAISSAVDSASQMAEEDMNTEPVITPVVDMSNVHEAASEIDAELNKNAAIDISTGERNKANADNPVKGDGSITQIFNQNIESPKPLSRLEIYRQTKNLFGMAKSINMVQ